jgi:hypothetical protein
MSNQPLGINKNEFNTTEQCGQISLVISYNPIGAISKDFWMQKKITNVKKDMDQKMQKMFESKRGKGNSGGKAC